jgi:structure-specific endonuclease subunit SLX1
LTLRFFNEQIHKAWLDLYKHDPARLSPGIDVILDLQDQNEAEEEAADGSDIPPSSQARVTNGRKKSRWAATGAGGVRGLDITYALFDTHIQKSISVLREAGNSLKCGICRQGLGVDQTVVCPHAFCEHTSHLVCLASVFLGQEPDQHSSALLPTKGYCPSCRGESKWGDLAKELSLRSRSLPKRGKTGETRSSSVSRAGSLDGRDDDEGEISLYDLADIPEGKEAEAAAEAQARILEDDWSESELEDFIGKHVSHANNHGPKSERSGHFLSVVEEESDG